MLVRLRVCSGSIESLLWRKKVFNRLISKNTARNLTDAEIKQVAGGDDPCEVEYISTMRTVCQQAADGQTYCYDWEEIDEVYYC
jgi:hypothetical protein